MKLFLNLPLKHGKLSGYIDPVTKKLHKKWILYPDKATEVPDDAAELMLAQSKNVSKKAYEWKKKAEEKALNVEEVKRNQRIATLQDIADTELDSAPTSILNQFYKRLGEKPPSGDVPKPDRIKGLEELCTKVAQELEP